MAGARRRRSRHASPLPALAPSAILSRVVGARWLAVGDAASAYDPVAAQGIVKALCDGEAAADAIAGFFAGAGEAPLLEYQDGVFARFTDYLRLRQHLYGLERRWPQAPFWQNRLAQGGIQRRRVACNPSDQCR